MKLKQKLKPFIYTAAVLCVSISCKTNDPSACGPTSQKLTCIANIKNAKADYDGYAFDIENQGFVMVCENCQNKTYSMKLKPSFVSMGTKPYKYRLWGQIYRCDNCPNIAGGINILYLYIDKIEYQN